jgi:hypothetical protein
VTTGPTVWAVSLALLASVALAPTSALAQRGGGMSRGGGGFAAGQTVRGGGFAGQTARGGAFVAGRGAGGGAFIAGRGPGGRAFIAGQPGTRAFVHGRGHGGHGVHHHHGHRFVHRPFNSFGTVVVWGAPFAYWPYYDTPLYNPPLAYAPPATYVAPPYVVPYAPPAASSLSLTPASPPTPSVVEFPTGRYELRGNGITEPYRWVWIPKPPTAPPAEPSAPEPPASKDPGPARSTPLYRWTDEQGTVHYTDRGPAVPDR